MYTCAYAIRVLTQYVCLHNTCAYALTYTYIFPWVYKATFYPFLNMPMENKFQPLT